MIIQGIDLVYISALAPLSGILDRVVATSEYASVLGETLTTLEIEVLAFWAPDGQ